MDFSRRELAGNIENFGEGTWSLSGRHGSVKAHVLCFWYWNCDRATCIRLRNHLFHQSPNPFKTISPQPARHPIAGALTRHALSLDPPRFPPVSCPLSRGLPRSSRPSAMRSHSAQACQARLTPAIAHSYVRLRAEDPGTLDVEDGVPPPRAAPALLRRVVLNLSTVRRSCSPPFGCGARNTSTTSSCRSPSTALGPLGTRTSTTGRGKEAHWRRSSFRSSA